MVAIFSKKTVLIPDVPVDIKTGEYHSMSVTSPSRAVQSGSPRNEHLIRNLDELTVAWEVSNVDEIGSKGQRATTVFNELRNQLGQRQTYEVLTKHFLYPSMVITNIDVENTGTFNGRLMGTISFREYNEVELASVKVSSQQVNAGPTGVTDKTASSQIDKGLVAAEEVITDEATEERRSLLSQLFK